MKGLRLAVTTAGALLISAGASVQSIQAASPAAPVGGPSATHAAGAAAAPIVTNGAWTVYHHDNGHTGFDSTQPTAAMATCSRPLW